MPWGLCHRLAPSPSATSAPEPELADDTAIPASAAASATETGVATSIATEDEAANGGNGSVCGGCGGCNSTSVARTASLISSSTHGTTVPGAASAATPS